MAGKGAYRFVRTLVLAAFGAAAVAGCARAKRKGSADSALGVPSSVGPPAGELIAPAASSSPPRLASDPPIVPLDVPGFAPAVVSVPIGATSARPIVIATHGMWDLPEGLCDNWRWIMGNRAWVLCPRGERMPDLTYRYRSGPALEREIDASVRALTARYPGFVDQGPMLYTGFSLGAILGAWVITHDPARYPDAVLIEGGEDRFTAASISKYTRGGGRRVLFACGLKSRVDAAEKTAASLRKAGLDARVVLGKLPNTGQFIHWYNGPVAEETKLQLGWLLEGDERWVAETP